MNQSFTYLKKWGLIYVFVCFTSINVFSQRIIDNFYGLRFGMTDNQVEFVLKSKDIKYYWVDFDDKEKYASVKNIKFLKQYFNEAYFWVGTKGLSVANFSYEESLTNIYPSDYVYNEILTDLTLKYGEPNISTSTTSVWILNNGRIYLRIRQLKEFPKNEYIDDSSNYRIKSEIFLQYTNEKLDSDY